MIGPALHITAPAKVNLYLAVGDRRTDGYHDVTTVLAALSLSDEVTLREAGSLSLRCDQELGISAADNIAYRAAVELGRAYDREPAVEIELCKRIPHGAGLGGGSSDAAAVLIGLSRMWGIDRGDKLVHDVAAGLGADVPFFLRGGCALMDGRGDHFVAALPYVPLTLLVVRPDEPVPTGAAYAAFDRQLRSTPPGPGLMVAALESGRAQDVAAALFNNMTDASAGLVESVAHALAWARALPGVLGSALAGSGSAVFVVVPPEVAVDRYLEEAQARGWWATVTRTIEAGPLVTTVD